MTDTNDLWGLLGVLDALRVEVNQLRIDNQNLRDLVKDCLALLDQHGLLHE